MAYNGTGVFNRLYNWVADAAANINIRADRMDDEMNGFATGLSTCLTRDGQAGMEANLDMGGFEVLNVENPTTPQSAVTKSFLEDKYLPLTGGELTGNLLITEAELWAKTIRTSSTDITPPAISFTVTNNPSASLSVVSSLWSSTRPIVYYRAGGSPEPGNSAVYIGFTLTENRGILIDTTSRKIGAFNNGFNTEPVWLAFDEGNAKIALSGQVDNASGVKGLSLGQGDLLGVRRLYFGVTESITGGDFLTWDSGGGGLSGFENGTFSFQIPTSSNSTATKLPSVHGRTTATVANVTTLSGGEVLRSTSSGLVKTNVRDVSDGTAAIGKLRPVYFKSLLDVDDKERDFIGFIAEEVAEVIPAAAADENYDTRAIVAILVSAVQELTARVKHLESVINAPHR